MIKITCDNSIASLEFFGCEVSPKGAVIICPGGGYSFLSPREAAPVARAINACGYHAFVLYYETEKEILGDLPLHQLGEAVAYVRQNAVYYDLEGKKILVGGFSAGGHLAASLGILWNRKEYFPEGTDLLAHKPDGMILCYPVITSGEAAHRRSMVRLAGEDREAQKRYSLELHVDQDAIPAFIWGTAADDGVSVENSLLLLAALTKAKIPVEYHLYPYGVHGLSLATEEVAEREKDRYPDMHVARWIQECRYWMDEIINA